MGRFVSEPAAWFESDAKLSLAVGEEGFHLRIAFQAFAMSLIAGRVAL
jgi:hypothetical protein